MTTREKIIQVAIEEFGINGYESTSMRRLAEYVGIKASAIYNHFKNKEEILEEIFNYYRQAFGEGNSLADIDEEKLKDADIPTMLKEALNDFLKTITQPDLRMILQIMMKEQLRNAYVRAFFLEEFIERAKLMMEVFLEKLMKVGKVKVGDPKLLAEEFNAFPIYKIYSEFVLGDIEKVDMKKIYTQLCVHIDFFWKSIKRV